MKKITLLLCLLPVLFIGCVPRSQLDQANSDLAKASRGLADAQVTVKSLRQDLAAAQAKLETNPKDYVGNWKAEITKPVSRAPHSPMVKIILNMQLPAKGDAAIQVIFNRKEAPGATGPWEKLGDFLVINRSKGAFTAFRISAKTDSQLTLLSTAGEIIPFTRIP